MPAAMSSAPSASRPATRSNGRGSSSSSGSSAAGASPGCPTPRRRCSAAPARPAGTRRDGGFLYTLDWDGKPHLRNRLWWPAAEGVGAAAFLNQIDGAAEYEEWYRRIWDFIAGELIDREHGGWRTEPIDPTGEIAPLFSGKPDLYHALQACLIPLLPTTGSITRGLATGGLADI